MIRNVKIYHDILMIVHIEYLHKYSDYQKLKLTAFQIQVIQNFYLFMIKVYVVLVQHTMFLNPAEETLKTEEENERSSGVEAGFHDCLPIKSETKERLRGKDAFMFSKTHLSVKTIYINSFISFKVVLQSSGLKFLIFQLTHTIRFFLYVWRVLMFLSIAFHLTHGFKHIY